MRATRRPWALKGRQMRSFSCAGYWPLPLVGRQGNSRFRALAGRRTADSANHVPVLSPAFLWLFREGDIGHVFRCEIFRLCGQ